MLKTSGGVIHTNASERELMAAIDATIAETEKCHCGASVHVETTRPGTPYKAWLVCDDKTGCGRRKLLE